MPVRPRVLAIVAFAGLWMAATALMSSAHTGGNATALMVSAQSSSSDGDPIQGRKIFLRDNCYSCHGNRAGGGTCPSLREDPPDESDVRDAVEEGTPTGMPPFPNLTEQDHEDLAAYFETLGTANEPTFNHWWEPGVPTQ